MLVELILLLLIKLSSASDYISFTYNGFSGTMINIDGLAEILPNGLLRLTNTTEQNKGHAFHPNQIQMRNSSTGDALSFSTSFVFGIQPLHKDLFGHGIAFVLSRSNNLSDGLPSQYLGSLGYLAPELTKTGKATTSTDVYAFGAFLLETACGRRPIEMKALPEEMILVDWVLEFWKKGKILEVRDSNLGNEYNVEEMEMVLKLGLLCSHPNPAYRARMWMVMQVLEGNAPFPDVSLLHYWNTDNSNVWNEGFEDYVVESLPSTSKSQPTTNESVV